MSIKQYYICIFTVLLFPLSCARLEENPEEAVPSADYFEAVIAAPTEETKTLLQGDAQGATYRSVYWQAGDVVLVGGANYTVTGGAGSPKARLSGGGAQLQDGKYKAYYPASIVVDSVSGELEMPAILTHPSPVDGKVVASNLPMYAESDGKDNKLSFRHLFAAFSFQITGTEKVRRIELTSTTHNLSGPFRITKLNTQYTKNLDIIEMTGTSEENKKIVLDFGPSGVQLSADALTEFLIPVPPSYSYRDDNAYYKTGGGIGSFTIKIYGDSQQPIREIENPSVGNPSAGKIVTLYKSKFLTVKLDNRTVTSPRKYQSNYGYSYYDKTEVYAYNDSKEGTASNHEIHRYHGFVIGDIDFTVTTNMGYTISLNDPDGAITGIIGPEEGDISLAVTPQNGKIVVSDNVYFPTSNYTPKPFTVNDAGDQVYFAPGNLFYRPSTNTWKFADRQWDYLGTQEQKNIFEYSQWGSIPGTVYDGARLMVNLQKPDPQSSDWTDIFAWGTSGYTGWGSGTYGSKTHPSSYITDDSMYTGYPWSPRAPFGPQTDDPFQGLTGDFAMGDWGVANRDAINAYHNFPSTFDWRTPTFDEYMYILKSRPNMTSLYKFVRLDLGKRGKNFMITFTAKEDPSYKIHFHIEQRYPITEGIMIFPDGFFQEHPELGIPSNIVSNWPDYEKAGCIYLPLTSQSSSNREYNIDFPSDMYFGSYIHSYVEFITDYGNSHSDLQYWTSTGVVSDSWYRKDNSYERVYFYSHHYAAMLHYTYGYPLSSGYMDQTNKWNRLPVRLVRSAPSATGNVNPGGIDSGGQDVEDIDVNDTEKYNYGW